MSDPKSCTICFTQYKETGDACPRSLSACNHTFCTKCLKDQIEEGKIVCAVCRAESPAKTIDDVKKPYALIELLFGADAAKQAQEEAQVAAPAVDDNNSDDANEQKPEDLLTHRLTVTTAPTPQPSELDVLVTIEPPAGVTQQRQPVDVVCVIDVSGSMGTEATLKTNADSGESNGLSLLDVVKHAVTTVAHALDENDRLAIVTYSDYATVEVPLASMTDAARKGALEKLNKLEPRDMTNLWSGLKLGVECLGEADDSPTALTAASDGVSRAAHVFLLTDGMPNMEPARGHQRSLTDLLQKQRVPVTVSTFGFGYNINTPLLIDLAAIGCGEYAFIPDAGFVGTAFVNGVATALTTTAQNVVLSVNLADGATFQPAKSRYGSVQLFAGQMVSSHSRQQTTLALGPLVNDAARHIALRVQLDEARTKAAAKQIDDVISSVKLTYRDTRSGVDRSVTVRDASRVDGVAAGLVAVHAARTELVNGLFEWTAARQVRDDAGDNVNGLIKSLQALGDRVTLDKATTGSFLKGLIDDLQGQVTEAFSRGDWFKRWGRHYLPSLARAHALEQCTNFKDIGLQAYAGPLFDKLQTAGDELFCALPPPKPSRKAAAGRSYRPIQSMSTYHNSYDPCFHVDARVSLADGSLKSAGDIKAGDRVLTRNADGSNGVDTVECVVRTEHRSGHTLLVTLPESGLRVTPYHPIELDGRWQWPVQVKGRVLREQHCPAVVSFLLAKRTARMVIDGVSVATLAHGLNNDQKSVIAHPFFGTERVVDNLRALRGFADGQVVLEGGRSAVRENGFVTALIQ